MEYHRQDSDDLEDLPKVGDLIKIKWDGVGIGFGYGKIMLLLDIDKEKVTKRKNETIPFTIPITVLLDGTVAKIWADSIEIISEG